MEHMLTVAALSSCNLTTAVDSQRCCCARCVAVCVTLSWRSGSCFWLACTLRACLLTSGIVCLTGLLCVLNRPGVAVTCLQQK